ncbi:DUF3047 domain-containing protein [Roseinatronobacter bogoriensis]|nr:MULTISPECIES: DUF3047 domain-containing protein [Rhodobaca]MBB4208965.1 hypothetical protein [Rhodobaca bogoriensis DSM 18756]TDW37610.1 Protein of unknown function (DUF3047) [Rhodobaca barguzinensis]TDY68220.1 DUF3047 family protein [Rhodobaca bogoriensis DSM 18756]
MTLSRRDFLTASATAFGATAFLPAVAGANTVAFDTAWDHLTFRRLTPNRFELRQNSLTVISEGTSSILYRILPSSLRGQTRASWTWEVERTAPPSDLSEIGNDDRNLGVFFVSMPEQDAASVREGTSISRLLRNRSARVLMYTWGGNQPPGTVVPSPHAPDRLRNLITRRPEIGRYSEAVDLTQDFPRVFNSPLERLVAVAVSSNSENTPTRVVAHVQNLTLG